MQNPPETPSASTAKQLPELFEILQPHLKALDSFLLEQVSQFEPEIREHAEYSIDTGGKRIRPSLIFFSGWQADGQVDENLVRLAAVVETVHLATLVHDDIMDEADIRRNRATVARKYNNATAVLLGDALFSHAVYLATLFPTNEVCRNVAESTRKVCTGEILQTMQRGDPDLDMATYLRVIDLKTAELFRVACFLGARLGGYSDAYVRASGAFGRHLGIAYQIYDDMTDLFGSQEKIGKTLGTDIATGKPTMPLILMRDRLPAEEARALRDTLSGKREADIPYWLEKLRQMGIFEEVRQAIFQEIEKARDAVAPYQNQTAANYLHTISQLLWNQVAAL
ncbi:polyprenyl synthetase family protein [Pelagicoccus sp. SDUM812003]|uniref:polyprenyl synthetase family protein n=1 Tax=Pelagicoccus sp. SDUM812003 TaxID=3041267 RepID=UPI00280E7E60|nr:polyprenyl synthetase family protein [Pelagicoccus sp. SDUM812003]MDQ8201667.1 polyprenyl synthetase family protein [Pelagicoccus sp. SDUM812003]